MKLKALAFSLLFSAVWAIINCNDVKALSTKEVSTEEAQTGVDLEVYAGYGLTISFQKTGERITQAWLADPSKIVFSTNSKNCSKSSNSSCNSDANVIFLRQIKQLNFPNMTSSRDGGTQLVILTSSNEGQKQYLFRIQPTSGSPQYTSVVLSPSNDRYQDRQQLLLSPVQNPATNITQPFPGATLNYNNP